jgi:Immunity protein 27
MMEPLILTGQWVMRDEKVVGGEVCEEIRRRIAKDLFEIGRDASGWDMLYRERSNDVLWELTYPHSELQAEVLHNLRQSRSMRRRESMARWWPNPSLNP